MLVIVTFLLYPFTQLTFSITGTHNFISGANHLLHGRVKKAAFSWVKGGFKLAMTVGLAYIAFNSIFSKFNKRDMDKVNTFNNFKLVRAETLLDQWAFTKSSNAEKIVEHGTYFFRDNPS